MKMQFCDERITVIQLSAGSLLFEGMVISGLVQPHSIRSSLLLAWTLTLAFGALQWFALLVEGYRWA